MDSTCSYLNNEKFTIFILNFIAEWKQVEQEVITILCILVYMLLHINFSDHF